MKKTIFITSLVMLLAAAPAMSQMMGGGQHMYQQQQQETQQQQYNPYQMNPGMMGGYGYGMGPGMMGYGMGPNMMGGYGHGMHHNMMGGGCYNMGFGMMGGYGMRPGMMGYGMGPQMMGGYGYGMGPGMMGYNSLEQYEKQFKENQDFLNETKELRKKMHTLRFDYAEALRDPETDKKDLEKLNAESIAAVIMLLLSGCTGRNDQEWEKGAGVVDISGQEKRIPDFHLLSPILEETVTSSDALEGKVALIIFFASWCRSCLEEIPLLKKLQDRYRDQEFSILAITIDRENELGLRNLIKKQKINYPVLLANEAVKKDFGGIAILPTMFLVSREGMLLKKYSGHIERSSLIRDIEQTLNL
jgi:thiol-disulfide isomerase/thioredoxin